MDNRKIQELVNATAYDRDGDKLGAVKEVFINDASGQPDFVEVGHGLFGMSSSLVPLRGHRLEGENLKLAFDKERIKDAPEISDDAQLTEEDQNTIYRHYELDSVDNYETYEPDRFDQSREDYDGREPYGNVVNTGVNNDRKNGFDDIVENRTAGTGQGGVDKQDIDGSRGPVGGAAAGAGVGAAGAAAGNRNDARFTDPDAKFQDGDRTDRDEPMVSSEERMSGDKDRVETGTARLRKYVVRDGKHRK